MGCVCYAVFTGQCGGCEIVRPFAAVVVLLIAFPISSTRTLAADEWGGSLALSSDYLVRGISRSSDHPALQLDLHYANPNGLVAGLFGSNTQIESNEPQDAELSAFVGFAWSLSQDWRAKVLANYYAYPWNNQGSKYNYDEFDFDIAYQGWVHFSLGYSPNSPRFLMGPYQSLFRVSEKSAEISAERAVWGKFSATGGVGYTYLGGPFPGGYAYWSFGGAYDFKKVTLALAYVNTSTEAKLLFYNAAADRRWTGTVLWRFW
jgi:uncharacterized protein (TIGR02001 family)